MEQGSKFLSASTSPIKHLNILSSESTFVWNNAKKYSLELKVPLWKQFDIKLFLYYGTYSSIMLIWSGMFFKLNQLSGKIVVS